MHFKPHTSFPLSDRSFQNIVKRDIAKIAEIYGFSEVEVGRINIIVSEMASNLLKHGAQAGELLVKPFGTNFTGFEIICLDQGPGMSEPLRMLEDGVSTVGTPGEGLGAIKRLSDEFDLYSVKGVGTVILSRIYKTKFKPKSRDVKIFDIGVVQVAKTGETHCGDGWYMHQDGNVCKLLVVDGLGHGIHAEEASHEAVTYFQQHTTFKLPCEIMPLLHQHIKRTRGVVGNISIIDLNANLVTYCGVGNIAGRVLGSSIEVNKSIVSYNGIIGHNIPTTLHSHEVPWNNSNLLILHSDGLQTKWDLGRYKDIQRHDPSVIAALLYKDFARGTDDILVLVGRTRPKK